MGYWIPGLCTPTLAWEDCQGNNNFLYEDWRYIPLKFSQCKETADSFERILVIFSKWAGWLIREATSTAACQTVLTNDVIQAGIIDSVERPDVWVSTVVSEASTILTAPMTAVLIKNNIFEKLPAVHQILKRFVYLDFYYSFSLEHFQEEKTWTLATTDSACGDKLCDKSKDKECWMWASSLVYICACCFLSTLTAGVQSSKLSAQPACQGKDI